MIQPKTEPTALVHRVVLPVCGFPGVGKSHASAVRGWPDSDSSLFSWASPGVRNPGWPKNYIAHLAGLRGPVMVSTHEEVRDALHAAGISFLLCYPSRDCKAEYVRRYRQRGRAESFCVLVETHWDEWLEKLESDTRALKHLVLQSGQYASDIRLD
jgi:hypothetical protein